MSKQCINCKGYDVVLKKLSNGQDMFYCIKCRTYMRLPRPMPKSIPEYVEEVTDATGQES